MKPFQNIESLLASQEKKQEDLIEFLDSIEEAFSMAIIATQAFREAHGIYSKIGRRGAK